MFNCRLNRRFRCRESFEGAKKVIHEIHKWDDFELKPVILVANKTDLVRSRSVTKQGLPLCLSMSFSLCLPVFVCRLLALLCNRLILCHISLELLFANKYEFCSKSADYSTVSILNFHLSSNPNSSLLLFRFRGPTVGDGQQLQVH